MPSEEYYKSKWKKVVNVMIHQNSKVSKIAPAGSRPKQQHTPNSDMDVIYSVSGDPSKENFHPELIKTLKSNFSQDKVYPGSNNNVVHIDFQTGGKFDIVLLPGDDFDEEHENILEYKKKNL